MAGLDQYSVSTRSRSTGSSKHISLLHICIHSFEQLMDIDRHTVARKKFDSPKLGANYNIHHRFTSVRVAHFTSRYKGVQAINCEEK